MIDRRGLFARDCDAKLEVWKRRHAVSNELIGAIRSFWEHIVEAAENRVDRECKSVDSRQSTGLLCPRLVVF